MINRLTLAVSVRLLLLLAEPARRLRAKSDDGMETADKILWAAAITVVVGAVGAIFRDKLKNFANGLSLTLGW
jgi:hypothetical protein